MLLLEGKTLPRYRIVSIFIIDSCLLDLIKVMNSCMFSTIPDEILTTIVSLLDKSSIVLQVSKLFYTDSVFELLLSNAKRLVSIMLSDKEQRIAFDRSHKILTLSPSQHHISEHSNEHVEPFGVVKIGLHSRYIDTFLRREGSIQVDHFECTPWSHYSKTSIVNCESSFLVGMHINRVELDPLSYKRVLSAMYPQFTRKSREQIINDETLRFSREQRQRMVSIKETQIAYGSSVIRAYTKMLLKILNISCEEQIENALTTQ